MTATSPLLLLLLLAAGKSPLRPPDGDVLLTTTHQSSPVDVIYHEATKTILPSTVWRINVRLSSARLLV